MSGISEKNIQSFKKEVGSVISRYNDIINNLTEMKESRVNDLFWNIRAELEIIIVELKSILQKEILIEKWQSKFHDELKGTRSKEKAKILLSKYNKSEEQVLLLLSTDLENGYKYLWKLKEVITAILAAFPVDKYIWVNGELKKDSEKVFEI